MINRTSAPTAILSNADALVGIVVALPEELATLTRERLQRGETCRIGCTLVIVSGAGQKNAAAAANKLVEDGAKSLVSWGCAAGLSADSQPGDLLIASQVIDAKRSFDTDSSLYSLLQQLLACELKVHSGKLYTSDVLVSLSQDKRRIHTDHNATALDMESIAIAEVAQNARIPFAIIRSVADPVTMDLPRAVAQALNDQGEVSIAKLLAHLSWHPWEIASLLRLGRHFKAAQKTLITVAKILQQQPAHQPWLAN